MNPEPARDAAARSLLRRLRLRTTLNEGVGILGVWQVCAPQQARDHLRAEHDRTGQDAEATRLIAVVNATADDRADPDARWD